MFIHHILENHIRTAERMCAKDPDILYYMEYLHHLFPKAKFLYMVRDGRDVAWSMIKQIKGSNLFNNFKSFIATWNAFNRYVSSQCSFIGAYGCLMVKYEDLVLNSSETLIKVTKFLGIDWTDDLLNHDKFLGSKIVTSALEWSTDQIKNPIYKDSINKWIGNIRGYDKKVVKSSAMMLGEFGYNTDLG